MLSTKNFKFKNGKKKFHPKFLGPFTITEMVGKNAARLELPKHYRLHPVFHVSLLDEYHMDQKLGGVPLPPTPEVIDGIPYYKVEKILGHRDRQVGRSRRRDYLIKWEGYDDTHNSWEPAANLTPDLLESYGKPTQLS